MQKSFPLPARISRSILLAMTPLFALSACKTVDVTLNARPCFTEMVSATGLKADTPHAQIPGPTVGEIEAYGNAEGGQLDKSNARARAITWMFAALNTVEPPILELMTARILEGDQPWSAERLPLVKDRIRIRLDQLSTHLGSADWLDGGFSAGDLMMVSVLLRLRMSGILDEYQNLAAYVARGEARPAYIRAFAAQLAVNAPSAGPAVGS